MVAVNPYTADIIASRPAIVNLYYTFDSIHSDLLIGKVGDYLLETAASLTILLILSGWYLWWQKRRSSKPCLFHDTAPNKKKRSFIRIIHAAR